MISLSKLAITAVLALSFSGTSVRASHHEGQDHHGKGHARHHGKNGPCKPVREACEAAGFKKGGAAEGKGLFKDCVKKIKDGETVAGVKVSDGDLQACKKWKEERRKDRKERKARKGKDRRHVPQPPDTRMTKDGVLEEISTADPEEE